MVSARNALRELSSQVVFSERATSCRTNLVFAMPGLLRVRIGTEDLYEAAMALQLVDGFGDLAIFGVAVAIDEEEVFPRLALAGAAFNLRHVPLIAAAGRQRVAQRA